MKKMLLGMGMVAAMLLVTSSAFAAGVNMRWDRCFGEGVGASNKAFACASNSGTNVLVCSFVLGAPVLQASGNELVVDVLTNTSPLPAWWDMKNAGTCRPTALGINTIANAADAVCVDWALGGSTPGVAYTSDLGSISPALDLQHRRIKGVLAVGVSQLTDLAQDVEYFACNFTISNVKSVGTGSCAGCSDPTCLVFNSIKVTTPVAANDVTIGSGTVAGSNIVTWQGAGPDCQAVPTRNTTWGAVKSLYR